MSSMILIAPALLIIASSFIITLVYGGNFHEDVEIHWGDGRGKILDDDGKLLSLSMDEYSGSGFKSKDEFLFGRFDVEMKLVPGNSAGTVTTFYLSSLGPTHDEIDFEFLGNLSGDPYTLHTNVFGQGKGNKEMQFHLWFDPTEDFHSYSILWNPMHIIFLVDDVPIRDFQNHHGSIGVPFPKDQPMRLYASLWDAENWATRGGLVKTDWSKAPFTAYYRYFNADACVSTSSDDSSCSAEMASQFSWYSQELDSSGLRRMTALQKRYMVYDYCTDAMRFPEGLPKECRLR